MLLYIMLKRKSALIFYLPFFCLQVHINKIFSFRKWESSSLIIFCFSFQANRLCIPPTEWTKNMCQESLHGKQWQQHCSKASALVGRWPRDEGWAPSNRRDPSGGLVPQKWQHLFPQMLVLHCLDYGCCALCLLYSALSRMCGTSVPCEAHL